MTVAVRSAIPFLGTSEVSLALPKGLTTDSSDASCDAAPVVGDATLFFRVTGKLVPGRDSIRATAKSHG